MKHFPHITVARQALALGDPGAENAGESMARVLVEELGLGGPILTQYPVLIGGAVVWLDIVVGRQAFELDGRLKFRTPEEGGVAPRRAGEIAWDEKERQRLVCAEGLGMARIIWDDFWGAARERARERLRDEARLTAERLGTTRPARLDEFAVRVQDARDRHIRPSAAV